MNGYDGEVVEYRWLSGTAKTLPDGGMDSGRRVPDGEEPDWPADKARTVVTLPPGEWGITLWVVDDLGAVSEPVTVRFVVSD